jgi:hypothetical protein
VAESILKLKKKAVDAGMPKADAMKADRKTLDEFLSVDHSKSKVTKKKVAKKKVAARTTTTKKSTTRKASEKKAPARKTSTRKAPKRDENTDGFGRLNIGSLDWSAESDEWNPKKGGPVERLFKALKSCKGDVDKAMAKVEDSVWDFVGKTKRDGTKRKKDDALAMLRYRLNRTKFEFAVRTGQHSSADAKNRAAYGTGDYATTRKVKPARKAKSSTKASTKKASTSGRKKSSTKKRTRR